MSKDPTFRVLGGHPTRSERYEAYRREWDRREAETDASDHPVHVDIETSTVQPELVGIAQQVGIL